MKKKYIDLHAITLGENGAPNIANTAIETLSGDQIDMVAGGDYYEYYGGEGFPDAMNGKCANAGSCTSSTNDSCSNGGCEGSVNNKCQKMPTGPL